MDDTKFQVTRDDAEQTLLLRYTGVCGQNILEGFSDFIMNGSGQFLNGKEMKTIIFCSNELIQNIGFYSLEKDASNGIGIGSFELNVFPTVIIMTGQNKSTHEIYLRIKGALDQINGFSDDELKQYYKAKIKSPPDQESKGGGIGLIEIRRKTKHSIDVQPIEENGCYVIMLKATIKRGAENE